MTVGQVVDYCIEYNKMHDYGDGGSSGSTPQSTDTRRKATQADWDALWG